MWWGGRSIDARADHSLLDSKKSKARKKKRGKILRDSATSKL